eukprot:12416039-Alexandrium_andersonii.AAC.1
MAERSPRLGVLRPGRSTCTPAPAGSPGTSTGPMTTTGSSACWARGGHTFLRGARRAPTGAASTCMSTTPAWSQSWWLRGRARP